MARDLSILRSTKRKLGLSPDYDAFDDEVIGFINSAFATLSQLGVGPETGFRIEGDDEVWDDFVADALNHNDIPTYVYLRVRFMFDPPTTGYLVDAMEKQIKEHEWRLNVRREDTEWRSPIESETSLSTMGSPE